MYGTPVPVVVWNVSYSCIGGCMEPSGPGEVRAVRTYVYSCRANVCLLMPVVVWKVCYSCTGGCMEGIVLVYWWLYGTYGTRVGGCVEGMLLIQYRWLNGTIWPKVENITVLFYVFSRLLTTSFLFDIVLSSNTF